MNRQGFLATAVLAAAWLSAPAHAETPALRLKSDLLGGQSATQVLTRWCADLKLAAPAVIHADRDLRAAPAPDARARALLKAGKDETIAYRRVRLMCGAHTLSEADNWYLPARLTPAMNHMLDTGDTPFGTVVKALNFHRQTLEATPLPGPHIVLRIRALLLTPENQPFSLVVENYTSELTAPR